MNNTLWEEIRAETLTRIVVTIFIIASNDPLAPESVQSSFSMEWRYPHLLNFFQCLLLNDFPHALQKEEKSLHEDQEIHDSTYPQTI